MKCFPDCDNQSLLRNCLEKAVDRLIHTQYKTAAAKWHNIKSRTRYRNMDSMEYETGLRCAGEYSDTMNANNLFFPNLFVFSQILKYCIIKMYK